MPEDGRDDVSPPMRLNRRTDRPVGSPTSSFAPRERARSAPGPTPPGVAEGSNATTSHSQARIVGEAPGAAADDRQPIALEQVAGARLLFSDVRTALLLVDEARYRAVNRLFGVSRDQSWPVTLVALALIAHAAHEKSDQLLKGPGGPTRADVTLGAAAARELVGRIAGPSSQETPFVAALLMIAMMGALVRPGLRRTIHGIRTSTHHARQSFNHRYGHHLPASAR
jgi:hypothetical protein